jgi:branched-chain amino acid aminotransferase
MPSTKESTSSLTSPAAQPFGKLLAPMMVIADYAEGKWGAMDIRPVAPLSIHPASHVLHYASSCFEGLKAYRWADGSTVIFRPDRHVERMKQSSRALVLPEPDAPQLLAMIQAAVRANVEHVPQAPGALYVRPLLFGTSPNIGAATKPADEATLCILCSPVGDYFVNGAKPLRLLVEDVHSRTSSQTGCVKTGGNYAAALGPSIAARARHGADQVLFCPGGEVQETGAANFLLLQSGRILTRSLDSSFLHGVTRDSILALARDGGYAVEERVFSVAEMLEWCKSGEAAVSGTAAVLTGVGELVYRERAYTVAGATSGAVTQELRRQLNGVQHGESADRHGWCMKL